MSSTPSPAIANNAAVSSQTTLQLTPEARKPSQAVGKSAGYGMPCAHCRVYYSADLPACPVCHGTERVAAALPVGSARTSSDEACPDPVLLEQERERFLREFKVQLLASQIQPSAASPTPSCNRAENHLSSPEPAVICQSCYDHLQERVDVLEAALHMDIKEATQIVYDAVWADNTDSDKSYENAAAALLAELRRRSGVPNTFGLMKPLAD